MNVSRETSDRIIELRPGITLDVEFEAFTARIAFLTSDRLQLEIIKGENEGFSDDVSYELRWLRADLAVLSWQEHIGSTVVHLIDVRPARTYTLVTPAKGGFLRLEGQISRVS